MPILGLSHSLGPFKPAHFDIEKVIRPNILALHPYRCARDDYKEGILLDANENALGHSVLSIANTTEDGSQIPSDLQPMLDLDLNRYPDPSHPTIKARIAALRGLPEFNGTDHIFLGVGSDEVIDLLMRICIVPGKEKILTTPPTYGMYAVCAQVNDVGIVKVPLEHSGDNGEGGENGRFSARVDEIKRAIDADSSIKLIFLCSPGNPTGTLIPLSTIRSLLDYEKFKGIVVVDEAYVEFSSDVSKNSAVSLVKDYANLCVMQTLSKSFGLAAIRLGIAIAQPPLIQILTNTKAPYNISTPTAQIALSALSSPALTIMKSKLSTLKTSRTALLSSFSSLAHLGLGPSIGGNHANFILIPILERGTDKPDSERAHKVYKALAEENGVVVRYRGSEPGCKGCLRITVGSEEENKIVLEKLEKVLKVL